MRYLLNVQKSWCGVGGVRSSSTFKYVQGQYNEHDQKIREYFYYVDHNGMLFLDDARMKNFTSCFKEKNFLQFFFKRIRRTEESRSNVDKYFPYTSHCGRERNYIRVHATPFVFSNMMKDDMLTPQLELNYTGMTRPLNPASLYQGSDGRLYHEFDHPDVKFALVRSQVADTLFTKMVYDTDDGGRPVKFKVHDDDGGGGKEVVLDYRVKHDVEAAITAYNINNDMNQ